VQAAGRLYRNLTVASFSAFAQKALLDFICGGATATQPSARWAGLAWGTPTYTGGSEINTSVGYARRPATFIEAASPAGSASLAAALTFGPFSSAVSVLGLQLWDEGSNMWIFGTFQTARTVDVGGSIWIPAGSMVITLP
jgi:hypothetical protein